MPDRPSRAVHAVAVLTGALALLWALATPAYRAVDEPQHLSTAWRLATGGGYPTPGTATLFNGVSASYANVQFPGGDKRTFVPPSHVSAPVAADPSLQTLEHTAPPADQAHQVDQMTQHPPLWNLLGAAELWPMIHADLPFRVAYLLLRILQGLLLVPIPYLLAAVARRVGVQHDWLPGLLLLAMPEYLHIGASVADGSLLLLEFAVALRFATGLVTGSDSRNRTALGFGVAATLTLLTKAFGLLLLPVGLVLAVVGRDRLQVFLRAVLLPGVLGGWWYVVRFVQLGTLQPSGYPANVETQFADHYSVWFAVKEFARRLSTSTWLDAGWFEVTTEGILAFCLLLLLLFGLGVGTRSVWRSQGLLVAALLAAPFLVLFGSVWLYEFAHTYPRLHAVYGAQGRYLWPGTLGAVVAIAFVLRRKALPRLAILGVVVGNAVGLAAVVRHFWRGGLATLADYQPGGYVLPATALALAAGAVCWLVLGGREAQVDLAVGGVRPA